MSSNKDSRARNVSLSPDRASVEPATDLNIDRDRKGGSWFRLLPRDTLILLAFLADVLGLLMIQFEPVTRLPFWMMVFCFAYMVWKRSALALACLLGVLIAVKSAKVLGGRQLRQWFDNHLEVLFASDIVFTLLVLAFAGACFRFLETRKYCLGILSNYGWGAGAVKSKNKIREFPSLLGGRWWLIPVAIAAAFVLLGVFPLDRGSVRKYWIRPEPARLIFLIGSLFLLWFFIRSLFMLVMRWKMDEDQAGVHVRSVYAKEFWREHRAIEARRAKAISKKS